MIITLNGIAHELTDADLSLAHLLLGQGYDGKLVAVAVNGVFVPRARYADTTIQANDAIEIVAPMQGG